MSRLQISQRLSVKKLFKGKGDKPDTQASDGEVAGLDAEEQVRRRNKLIPGAVDNRRHSSGNYAPLVLPTASASDGSTSSPLAKEEPDTRSFVRRKLSHRRSCSIGSSEQFETSKESSTTGTASPSVTISEANHDELRSNASNDELRSHAKGIHRSISKGLMGGKSRINALASRIRNAGSHDDKDEERVPVSASSRPQAPDESPEKGENTNTAEPTRAHSPVVLSPGRETDSIKSLRATLEREASFLGAQQVAREKRQTVAAGEEDTVATVKTLSPRADVPISVTPQRLPVKTTSRSRSNSWSPALDQAKFIGSDRGTRGGMTSPRRATATTTETRTSTDLKPPVVTRPRSPSVGDPSAQSHVKKVLSQWHQTAFADDVEGGDSDGDDEMEDDDEKKRGGRNVVRQNVARIGNTMGKVGKVGTKMGTKIGHGAVGVKKIGATSKSKFASGIRKTLAIKNWNTSSQERQNVDDDMGIPVSDDLDPSGLRLDMSGSDLDTTTDAPPVLRHRSAQLSQNDLMLAHSTFQVLVLDQRLALYELREGVQGLHETIVCNCQGVVGLILKMAVADGIAKSSRELLNRTIPSLQVMESTMTTLNSDKTRTRYDDMSAANTKRRLRLMSTVAKRMEEMHRLNDSYEREKAIPEIDWLSAFKWTVAFVRSVIAAFIGAVLFSTTKKRVSHEDDRLPIQVMWVVLILTPVLIFLCPSSADYYLVDDEIAL